MKRILVPFLVVVGACAPAPRQVVMTPELLDHAPRYRLVSPSGVEAERVEALSFAVQQELAQRGMLLAAPWETPTLQVSVAASEGTRSYGDPAPTLATMTDRSCAGAQFDPSHCTILDAAPLIPAAPPSQRVWNVSIRIQELGTGDVRFNRSAVATRPPESAPSYQLRLLTKQILGGYTP